MLLQDVDYLSMGQCARAALPEDGFLPVGGTLIVGTGGIGSIHTKSGADMEMETMDANPAEITFMTTAGVVQSRITGTAGGVLKLRPESDNTGTLYLGDGPLTWANTTIWANLIQLQALGGFVFLGSVVSGAELQGYPTAKVMGGTPNSVITVDANQIRLTPNTNKPIYLNGRLSLVDFATTAPPGVAAVTIPDCRVPIYNSTGSVLLGYLWASLPTG